MLTAKKYGITFGRGREEDTLRDLNRAFNENPLLRNNPQKAAGVEEAITGTTGLFDLLNRSPAEFDKLRKQASATPDISKQQEEDARRAHEAFTGLNQAVGKLGVDLGEFTNKWLVPLETAMTKVINTVNRSPGASEMVGIGVTAVAGGIAAKMLGSVGKLIGVLPKGLMVPAGPIAAIIGAVAAGYELYQRGPRTDNRLDAPWRKSIEKDKSEEAPKLLRDALDSLRRSVDDLRDWWAGAGGGGGVSVGMGRVHHGDVFGPARPAKPLNPADEKQATDFFMSKGLTKSQAAGVVGTLEQESRLDPKARNATGHTGIAQWDANRQRGLGGSTRLADQLNYIWQEWQGNEAAAFARIKAARTPEETAKAMEGYERGGDYGGRHQARARQIYETVPGAPSGAPALAPPPVPGGSSPPVLGAPALAPPPIPGGPSPPVPGSRVPARLQNLPGSEDQNPPRAPAQLPDVNVTAPAPRFAPPLPLPLPPGAGGAEGGGLPGPQGNLDTSHHFVLDIRNAPPGTRGQMVAQNGPATAEVKTSYALQGV
jgi:hypothetical protein